MKKSFFISLSLLILTFVFTPVFAHAAPVELQVPDYFVSGRYCPDPDSEKGKLLLAGYMDWGVQQFSPLTHIFLCGRTYSVQPDDPFLQAKGFKKPGEPVKGVFFTTYEEVLTGSLDKPYVQVWSNNEGEFMIPIRKSSINNYLGVFCVTPDGQKKYLVDLFKVDTVSLSEGSFNMGVPCQEYAVTSSVALDTLAPAPLGYVDEDGYLQCGVDRAVGGASGPLSDKYANFSHFVSYLDEVFSSGDNTFDPNDINPDDVPSELTQATSQPIEGRHSLKFLDDRRGTLAADQLFNPGYIPQKVIKEGEGGNPPLPYCSTITAGYKLVSTGGDPNFNYANVAGLAAGMAFPGEIQEMFEAIPEAVKNSTEICVSGGSVKKLAQFEYGDPDFPFQRVYEISRNIDLTKKLSTTKQKYKGTTDSAYNFGGNDGEDCRELTATSAIADKPFNACNYIVHPGDAETEYVAASVSGNFAFPTSGGLQSQIILAGTVPGISRLGIGSVHCTCSTLEGGACSMPEPAYGLEGHPTSSGYKITTEQTPSPNTFYGVGLSGALANLFANVLAQFQVALPNVYDNLGESCVPLDHYEDQAGGCGNLEYCEETVVCDPPGSTNCTTVGQIPIYAYTCDGTIGVTMSAETKIQGTSGESIGYTTQGIKDMFTVPYESKNSIGGTAFAKSDVTNSGPNTQEIKYGISSPVQGTANTDSMRFAKRMPTTEEPEDLLPIMINPYTGPEISGICDKTSFEEILSRSTLPDAFNYVGSTPIAPYTDQVAQAYAYAEEQTGVPCIIAAAIHFREGGNKPYLSLKDGHDISEADLPEDAATYMGYFKSLVGGEPGSWTVEDIIGGFEKYNGPGNAQCDWKGPWSAYDPPLIAAVTGYDHCPEFYLGEDNTYAMNKYSPRYGNMSLIYPTDGTRADLFCADEANSAHSMWPACPSPLEYESPGALTAAMTFFQMLGGNPNAN